MKAIIWVCSWFTVILFGASCSSKYPESVLEALEISGENRQELESVLEYYSKNPSDSLKYKAAGYLIANMPYHSFYKPLEEFDPAFDSIRNSPQNRWFLRGVFEQILDSMSQRIAYRNPEEEYDITYLDADFLIKNIELAFEAWYKVPQGKRASFEDFCAYILPYRCSNEPIEKGSRERFFQKYTWVYDYLDNGASIRMVVDSVTRDLGYVNMVQIGKYYPIPLSISQVDKSKLGLCDDAVNYLVNLFRSLGIISAREMVPHWGNHQASGHSWLYVKLGDEEYATDIAGGVDLKELYIGESIPVVYRTTFSLGKSHSLFPFTIAVTDQFTPTTDISIDNRLGAPDGQPVLCVFDTRASWEPVAMGQSEEQKFRFENIGSNVLYMAAVAREGRVIPANYPFFVDKDKQPRFLIPEETFLDSAILTRKFGLSTPRNKRKVEWIKCINGGLFRGADNRNFDQAKPLYKVAGFNSMHEKKVKINPGKQYCYVQFSSDGATSYLDKLSFYDEDGGILKGVMFEKENVTWRNSTFDNDPFSFSGGGKDFRLGIAFEKPVSIGAIGFRARNDGNQIIVGDEYELLYWDSHWKSLGRQVASDTLLYYNVPANALLWLKDHTQGKEEHIFTIGENKKQYWLGFDNY